MNTKELTSAELQTSNSELTTSDGCRLSRVPCNPKLACPVCRAVLSATDEDNQLCPSCGFALRSIGGVWRGLPKDRMDFYRSFIRDYETIRRAEGRGSADAQSYLALPFRDLSGQLDWQWKIRGASYRHLEAYIWPELERLYPQGLDLLDIGAGNCWLSYRVALRGHRPAAVDLILNEWDGLGAARHYLAVLKRPFPRFQAEMDRLPFANAQFDVVVFNASLHYSVNYFVTLGEALRCLRPQGHLLVMDSPIYRADESGQRMLHERHCQFEKQYGFRSDTVPSMEYLTYGMIRNLADHFGLEWEILRPWYGLQWWLRPIKAKLRRRREPGKFHILWLKRITA